MTPVKRAGRHSAKLKTIKFQKEFSANRIEHYQNTIK